LIPLHFTPEFTDHQLQMHDHRRGARGASFGQGQRLALLQDQRMGLGKIGWQRCGARHSGIESCRRTVVAISGHP
jgi:hypothetical protein